jgi:peptide/nickel transport system ATP-binding protein
MKEEVIQIQDLRVEYFTPRGQIRAVNGVNLSLYPQEKFGLVGESGSGKTTLALAILRLITPPGRVTGGRVLLEGKDLLSLSQEEMRQTRLAKIALIPQGAMDSLNPVMRVKDQFILAMRDHSEGGANQEMQARIVQMLDWVGLGPHVASLYPHELSGGMKQRVCIAIAISLRPKLILADEPSSALDVVVQRQVMETLNSVQERVGATILLVGHDMGLMAQFVDRVGVMYGGRLVEIGPVKDIFREPLHPYTQMLISSLPSLDTRLRFRGIPGLPVSLLSPPDGCLFNPRCPKAFDKCRVDVPDLREVRPGRWVACHLF